MTISSITTNLDLLQLNTVVKPEIIKDQHRFWQSYCTNSNLSTNSDHYKKLEALIEKIRQIILSEFGSNNDTLLVVHREPQEKVQLEDMEESPIFYNYNVTILPNKPFFIKEDLSHCDYMDELEFMQLLKSTLPQFFQCIGAELKLETKNQSYCDSDVKYTYQTDNVLRLKWGSKKHSTV